MAIRPKRPCSHPGCPNLNCDIHRKARSKDARPSSAKRGYGSEWRAIRDAHIKAHPLCVVCGERATDVDHIIPLESGGTNNKNNLQSLCHAHHSIKTNRFDGGFGNVRGRGALKP